MIVPDWMVFDWMEVVVWLLPLRTIATESGVAPSVLIVPDEVPLAPLSVDTVETAVRSKTMLFCRLIVDDVAVGVPQVTVRVPLVALSWVAETVVPLERFLVTEIA